MIKEPKVEQAKKPKAFIVKKSKQKAEETPKEDKVEKTEKPSEKVKLGKIEQPVPAPRVKLGKVEPVIAKPAKPVKNGRSAAVP